MKIGFWEENLLVEIIVGLLLFFKLDFCISGVLRMEILFSLECGYFEGSFVFCFFLCFYC